ncbi:hypothetical protein A1WG_00056 [Escherichia sp. KTE96]|uniref:DUF551 domain-containing protein n=1 Tax=Escherichia sp. KTE96 TaxID=1182697 RepID=UPI00033CECC5|nr:DUF551 domain-containing protein [Escherichia sp. KTE96]EGN8022392.1 DUF551 domain-containing protein [Escherichia coli]EOV88145.1 hypothetical protein A1WG_04378 [Escherichia sp. KTE96]EOV92375.1 hypothetical protein A1WG_01434 [Escherichia sp. KTE96]EOV93245.1 hypothetical protein A1WG_01346 [Escherichia sp. KTE96]EOV96149.1 hypothetical protein A1WG_00056 [Escherichia sp. KTE96]
MTTITREQAQKIIEAADEVISALAGTNEDVNPDSDNMLRLWDDLNDRHAPPEVVRELARIALASLEAEPVNQTYKLPVNTPCQDAPAHIWLQTAGVWPEDGELSELTWCSHNQHHDDTLYVRADLVNGNYPVTPDGWISCSERMPDDGQHVIILCDGAFVLYAQYRNGEFFDVVRNGEEFFETQSRNVTHWMPLPEPPRLKEL